MEHVKSAEPPADDAVPLWYWKLLSDVFPYRDTLLYLSQYIQVNSLNIVIWLLKSKPFCPKISYQAASTV